MQRYSTRPSVMKRLHTPSPPKPEEDPPQPPGRPPKPEEDPPQPPGRPPKPIDDPPKPPDRPPTPIDDPPVRPEKPSKPMWTSMQSAMKYFAGSDNH